MLKKIVIPLLQWYNINKRILPWRDRNNAYYTWVSEIMLQQTRVEAVKPYFQRFITALPGTGSGSVPSGTVVEALGRAWIL